MRLLLEMFDNRRKTHLYYLWGDPERGELTWRRDVPVTAAELPGKVGQLLAMRNAWAVAAVKYTATHGGTPSIWILRDGIPDRRIANQWASETLARNWVERVIPPGEDDNVILQRMGRVAPAFALAMARAMTGGLLARTQAEGQPGAALTGHYQLRFLDGDWTLTQYDRLWRPFMNLSDVVDSTYIALSNEDNARRDAIPPPRAIASLVGGKLSLVAEYFADASTRFTQIHVARSRDAEEMRDTFWENYSHLPRQAWLWGLSPSERSRIIRRAIHSWLESLITPAQLTWNDKTVLKLARGIFESGRWGDLPVLADALEESGNENQQLLAACRRGDANAAHAVMLAASAYNVSAY